MRLDDLSGPTRFAAFAGGLAVVFAAALGVGHAVGPVADEPVGHDDMAGDMTGDMAGDMTGAMADGGHGGHAETAAEVPGGLMVSQDGYTLRLADESTRPGRDVPLAFTVTGSDGHPVTDYDVQHEKRLHLIAVRRDFSGFQHVHPELGDDGVWTTDLDLTPGAWRVFADFRPTGGEPLTLGTDLAVAGVYRPAAPVAELRTAHVDGYTVTLDGDLTPGTDSTLRLAVSKDGRPVTDLEPYLGAAGHLVALRDGDLAYLHVHPEEDDELVFAAAVPSPGRYRLFLDFQHEGVVRTAAFALETDGSGVGHDDH
jgi:hypothetical protein